MITEEDFERLVEWVEMILNQQQANPPIQLLPPMQVFARQSVGFRGTWENPARWPEVQVINTETAGIAPGHYIRGDQQ